MVEGSCHCGKVRIAIDTAPEEVTDCNCSICRRYGTLWAYYHPKHVHITEAVPADTYLWGTREILFHRCAECGCVTHWTAANDPTWPRMGVNVRLMAPEVLAAARVHHHDGASMGGSTH
ncbi:MAG TPA: GFA family protein [Rhizomicrobium sp.]|nr:GFA family protein [Rhizomicrobium sp.]